MSQYGYSYGHPQGYQPPNAYSHLPPPSYSGPLYTQGDASLAQRSSHSSVSLESFEHNRQTIPGLGLNFSNHAAGWQQPWSSGPHELPSVPSQDSRGEIDSHRVHTVTNAPPQAKPNPSGTVDDAMEEGELSEGELEDIYEPGQIDGSQGGQPAHAATSSRITQPQHTEPVNQQTLKNVTPKDAQPSRSWEPEPSTRERSGSYSPYLSPREIHLNGQGSSPGAIKTTRTEPHQTVADSTAIKSPGGPKVKTVAEVKKQAQDAILRLWPLNIRYQNYIEEGIDNSLLDGLFLELGLDSAMAELTPKQLTPAVVAKPHDDSKKTSNDGSESNKSENAISTSEGLEKPKDKSEERKDRIARLLAAKGSKSNAAAGPTQPEPTAPKIPLNVPTAPRAHGLTKTQSDKSKLIQQKMEALRKAREAHASKTPQSQAPTTPVAENNLTQPPSLPDAPAQSNISNPEPSTSTSMLTQPLEDVDKSDSNGTPSIPGLFLSSTPQPSPVVNQRKRPVASDLNEYSVSTAYKRPFGQNRESRPFLIDVSDDEDDAEMEIDSPEQRPASIHRPATPSRTGSFRDHPALSDSAAKGQYSSPKTAGTPTGPGTGGNGLYDLESMNKKIEDMKRKIAEAEARKKAKQSSNGTPSLPQSQDQSKEGSVDITDVPPSIPKPITVSGNEAEESGHSTLLISRPTSPASLRLPKVRGEMRDMRSPLRLRIASERLPILEARRKDQVTQLRKLQAEVARIEKDIQDNMQEEERLRQEVIELESNQGVQDDSELEVIPSEPVPPTHPVNLSFEEGSESGDSESLLDQTHKGTIDEPESVEIIDATNHGENVGAPNKVTRENETSITAETSANDLIMNPVQHAASAVVAITTPERDNQQLEDADSNSEADTDVAMDEGADSNSEDGEEDLSEDYEPTETGVELPNDQSPPKSSPVPSSDEAVLETSDTDLQGVSATSPVAQQISTADGHSASVSDSGREVEQSTEPEDSGALKSTFMPYKTPLSCFHAYRFHPEYKDYVAGGLRSLTYSNKIDAKREVCPDELVNGVCPKGKECKFQHFDNMKAPDDQILLQLGAYSNYEGNQKQQYIAGLRELLTDFRNRKIKDFQAISEGIIEYRTKFHGDKTKILPLGNVAI